MGYGQVIQRRCNNRGLAHQMKVKNKGNSVTGQRDSAAFTREVLAGSTRCLKCISLPCHSLKQQQPMERLRCGSMPADNRPHAFLLASATTRK